MVGKISIKARGVAAGSGRGVGRALMDSKIATNTSANINNSTATTNANATQNR